MNVDLERRLRALRDPADRVATRSTRPAASAVVPAARHARLAALTAVFLVLAGSGVAISSLAESRGPRRSRIAAPGTSSTNPAAPTTRPAFGNYRPHVQTSNGISIIQGRFPDGTRVALHYPADLALEDVGVRPTAALSIDAGGFSCDAQVLSSYGTDAPFHRGGSPVATYTSSHGPPATLWESYPNDPAGHYLVFEIGEWNVAVLDTSSHCVTTQGAAEAWAQNLGLVVDATGFVELVPGADVRFRESSLTIAGSDLHVDVRELPEGCDLRAAAEKVNGDVATEGDVTVMRSEGSATWCTPRQPVQLHADTSDRALLERLVDGLRVSMPE